MQFSSKFIRKTTTTTIRKFYKIRPQAFGSKNKKKKKAGIKQKLRDDYEEEPKEK